MSDDPSSLSAEVDRMLAKQKWHCQFCGNELVFVTANSVVICGAISYYKCDNDECNTF